MESSLTVTVNLMITYNSIWSILIQWNRIRIDRLQSGLVNTKESVLPVRDKSYHMNKRKVHKGGLKFCGTVHLLQERPLLCLLFGYHILYNYITAIRKGLDNNILQLRKRHNVNILS